MRHRIATLTAVLMLSVPTLGKQARGEEPGLPKDPSSTMTETSTGTTVSDDVSMLYRAALQALSLGRRAAARAILLEIETKYPRTAIGAAEMLGLLESAGPDEDSASAAVLGRDTPATALSRAELIVIQSLHGIAVGGELCAAASCDDERLIGASLILGGGLGFGLSFFLTVDGITPGHTSSINSGMFWGLWNSVAIMGMVQPRNEGQVIPGSLVIGQIAGVGLGELAWRATHASSGDVSLASSVGIWSGVLTLLIHGATEFEADQEVVFATLLAASDLGLVGGAFLADLFPMSRGHALVIDGGGALGMLVGMGLDLLIQGDDLEPAPFFTLASIGMASGLGLTAYLTRNWDAPDPGGPSEPDQRSTIRVGRLTAPASSVTAIIASPTGTKTMIEAAAT
jgi:hypothetical protein